EPQTFTFKKWPDNLFVVHTQKKLCTQNALSQISLKSTALKKISRSTELFLEHENWQQSILEHAQSLEELGVVPSFVKEAQKEWQRQNLVLASKTTGAGGGDALLLLINPDKKEILSADLKKRGWYFSPYEWDMKRP